MCSLSGYFCCCSYTCSKKNHHPPFCFSLWSNARMCGVFCSTLRFNYKCKVLHQAIASLLSDSSLFLLQLPGHGQVSSGDESECASCRCGESISSKLFLYTCWSVTFLPCSPCIKRASLHLWLGY